MADKTPDKYYLLVVPNSGSAKFSEFSDMSSFAAAYATEVDGAYQIMAFKGNMEMVRVEVSPKVEVRLTTNTGDGAAVESAIVQKVELQPITEES